jgi:elongation factor 1-alpha
MMLSRVLMSTYRHVFGRVQDHNIVTAPTVSQIKKHVSIVICGHVDAGKSTTTGRLIFELGGIPEREMQKLRDEAEKLGKGSFAFAFYMDRQKDERERGVTISVTTKEFFTNSFHYTVLDAPGHRDFIKNMITGASQADIALIMIPADGNFATSIAKGNHKAGEVQGQTRQHSLLINLLGIKQIIIGVNKMDCDLAGYKEARYTEVKEEMANVLTRVGWKKEFVDKQVPFLPISGWKGDNLITKSANMPWWKGTEIEVPGKGKKLVHTLLDALEEMVVPPERLGNKPMRTPISGVYKIKGAGDVLTGRVEQGTVKPGEEVVFLPTHTTNLACAGKIFSVEMHHKSQPVANAGDNVGLNIKGLVKENMPRVGDIMILKSDGSIKKAKEFTAQVQILNHPGELKVGYSPIAFVRTARSAVRMSKIVWKISKETGNKKAPDPSNIKANEMAEVVFQPMQPFVVDSFKNCEGLGRIAIMEGATVVMLGKVIDVVADDGKPPEDPKAAKAGAGAGAAPAKGGAAAAPAKGGAAAAKPAAKPPAKK